MGIKTVYDNSLTAVADAIRAKGKTAASLVFPAGFVQAIQDIKMDTLYDVLLATDLDHYGHIDYENNTATSMLSYAFYGATNLRTLVLGEMLEVSYYGLSDARNLEALSLPKCVAIRERSLQGIGARTGGEGIERLELPMCQQLDRYALCIAHIKRIVLPAATTIADGVFYNTKCRIYDFSGCSAVPALQGSMAFQGIEQGTQIIVPDDLYSTWIEATNWVAVARYIVRASDYNGS